MKRHFHLYDRIVSFDNLLAAAFRAAKGKRSRPNVAEFLADLGSNVLELHRELCDGTWQPGPYRTFWIDEPKPRLISAAPFRDRVVHHAICNVIEPLFEPTFVHDSYACRKGKGTHAAVDRYTAFSRQYRYVLKCDLEKFFPSMDHVILSSLLARKIGCTRTLALLNRIIESSNPQVPVIRYFPGDDLFAPHERRRGIPIGNLTSQFFANVYLNPFDHFVKEVLGWRAYIRYCDDFVIFGDDKRALAQLLPALTQTLAHLRMIMHEHKCRVHRVSDGLDFLGYLVWPTHRRLRRTSVVRFTRRRRKLRTAWRTDRITLDHIRASLASWAGHAGHADAWRLRETMADFVW